MRGIVVVATVLSLCVAGGCLLWLSLIWLVGR